MIKINLATLKQSALVSGKDGQIGTGLFKKVNIEQIKDLPLRKMILPVMVGLMANYLLENYKEGELSTLDTVLNKIKAETANSQKELSKYKSYEGIKKALEADEILIRTKLSVIQKLVSHRSDSADLLLSISASIPKDVWLSEYKSDSSNIYIKGSSLDFGHVSDFMKTLGQNAVLGGVELVNSQQKMDDKMAREIAEFELKVIRR